MTEAVAENGYHYLSASTVVSEPGAIGVRLATSGGCGAHPWLAEGFVASAQPAARALLLVADIAGKRFWMPPNMVAAAISAADPVVTTSKTAIRFESLSPCCGVYARFDLRPNGFDGEVHEDGTTNVDVNPPMRAALARIGARDPLRLRIGADALEAATLDGVVVERRVPLPERWVRGFAELAVATARLEPSFELEGAGLRRFLGSLPTTASRGAAWVVPTGSTARVSTRTSPEAVPAIGIERLRILGTVAPFLRSIMAFGDPQRRSGVTTWIGAVDGGEITLALSPTPSRGFSGEGGLLFALAAAEGGEAWPGGLDAVDQAATGRLGYDLGRATWFPRDLPFDRSRLRPIGGRLDGAADLLAEGGVAIDGGGSSAVVTSGRDSYRVRRVDGAWRCTCPWWGRHGDDRGPCKHVLATVLATQPAR